MDPLLITAIMFGVMLVLMATGIPIAFGLGVTAAGVAYALWGFGGVSLVFSSAFEISRSFILVALPLFILMGVVLQTSGIADDLFGMFHKILGGTPGGLAIGTVVICAIIAAMAGISGAATISMGLIALPAMLKRNYDKQMITGTIQAGGALGFLIPPSLMMVIYGFLAKVSVGRLFAGGVVPGLMLATFYMIYIGVRCRLQPSLGPPIAIEERVDWRGKIKASKALVLPGFLIFMVMGLIVMGVTSVTEASAVGASGAFLCAAINRRLTWKVVRESVIQAGSIMGMMMWIMIAAVFFSKVYVGLGAHLAIEQLVIGSGLSRMGVLIIMVVSLFVMGCFLDDGTIIFVTTPLYVPIIRSLGFDPVWYGLIFVMSMQIAYLTPPFGFNLFYMRAVAPPEITMGDIYRSVFPFVILQLIGLTILIAFPQLILWLPTLLFD